MSKCPDCGRSTNPAVRLTKWLGSVVAAVLVSGGVLTFVLQDTPAVATACGSASAADHPGISRFLCKRDFERVTDAQAEEFVDTFLRRISGTQRDVTVGHSMMTPAAADSLAGDWHTVIYAERISGLTRSPNPNQFVATIRRYRVVPPERVDRDRAFYKARLGLDEINLTATLVASDSGTRARTLTLADRNPLRTVRQRYVLATVLTDNYKRPERADDGAQNLGPPQGAYEICQLEHPAGSGTWWARTYLGWTPHADLEGGEGRHDGTELCEDASLK